MRSGPSGKHRVCRHGRDVLKAAIAAGRAHAVGGEQPLVITCQVRVSGRSSDLSHHLDPARYPGRSRASLFRPDRAEANRRRGFQEGRRGASVQARLAEHRAQGGEGSKHSSQISDRGGGRTCIFFAGSNYPVGCHHQSTVFFIAKAPSVSPLIVWLLCPKRAPSRCGSLICLCSPCLAAEPSRRPPSIETTKVELPISELPATMQIMERVLRERSRPECSLPKRIERLYYRRYIFKA